MSDNPFAEPGDDARTVILPAGDLRLPAVATEETRQFRRQPGQPAVDATVPAFGDLPSLGASPVVAAAAPLLSLLGRLRNLASVPDPAALRDGAVDGMRRYEQDLRDLKLPMDQVRTAHYALCASLDDVVQNTPWGSRGAWADASLVSSFHQEVRSGDRFFELLAKLSRNAGQFLPVIELMYLCMALGMQGRYRLSPRGPAELERVREETYLILLRQRGAAERSLSPHWQGVAAPYRRPGGEVPVWLAALGGAGLIGLLFATYCFSLNVQSDRLFEVSGSLPPRAMPGISRVAPPRPVPPLPPAAQPPGPRETLAAALEREIGDGQLSIGGSEAVPILRLRSTGMFANGSATLDPMFLPVLDRIGGVIGRLSGRIEVIGYTDNQPIHTIAFPSNFQLSAARARAAAAELGRGIDPARISAAGRADADSVASNATASGRQQNRRVEIVLRPQEPSFAAPPPDGAR